MNAARRNVLVKCGDSQKPVGIGPPWRRKQLLPVVWEKFSLPPATPILLQIYDQVWEAYIDIEDDDEIPDRGKVNCIVRPIVYSHETTVPHPASATPAGTHLHGAPPHSSTSSIQNQRSLDLESAMTETGIRLPNQQYQTTRREPVCGQVRNSNVFNHGQRNDTRVKSKLVLDEGGESRHSSGLDTVSREHDQLSNSDSVQLGGQPTHSDHTTELEQQSTNHPLYIELAEEEFLPVSDDDSIPDDLDCLPDVHFENLWPKSYTLPNDVFPLKLVRALENQEQLDWSQKHILVQGIADSILKYTTYPSQGQRDEVVTALFKRYPYLARGPGNGFSRWQVILNQKFKNVRRKMNTPEVVSRKRKRADAGRSSPNSTMNDGDFINESVGKRSDDDLLEMSVYEEDTPFLQQESPDTSQTVTDDALSQADVPGRMVDLQTEQKVDIFTKASRQLRLEENFFTLPEKSNLNWPTPFVIPKHLFPPVLYNALESKQKLDGPKANLLIRCLSDSIQPYTLFPSVKQREEVAQCLVHEYPHLIDNSPTGWTNHFIKLSERFKNLRRKLLRNRKEQDYMFPRPPAAPQDSPGHAPSTSTSLDTSNIKIEVP